MPDFISDALSFYLAAGFHHAQLALFFWVPQWLLGYGFTYTECLGASLVLFALNRATKLFQVDVYTS